jgi:hypothetical protein
LICFERRRSRRRTLIACRRCGGFDLGGQNVPVLIAERLRDQLQSFGMCGFRSLLLSRRRAESAP